MKRMTILTTLFVLTMTLVVGAGVALADSTDTTREIARHGGPGGPGGAGLMGFQHEANYLNILVERYAPETAAQWQAAIAARKAAMPERPTTPPADKTKTRPEKASDQTKATAKDERTVKEIPAEVQAFHALSSKLATDVANNDAAAVQADLAQLLPMFVQQTETMRTRTAN
jgi:hypothetical protein